MIIQMIAAGLAGWRLASLLVNEAGPYDVFARFRAWAGTPDVGEIRRGFLPDLLQCVWCASVWTTTAMWVFWYVLPEVVLVFGAMAVAVTVEQFARMAKHDG